MNLTADWSTTYDRLIFEAISKGEVIGVLQGSPEKVIESGLAYVFFYGDTVYKLYKTYDDKDHFIKGVLAPTKHRTVFLKQDFSLNQHFSSTVYKQLYSVYYREGKAEVLPFDGNSIYTLIKMSRLDFSTNLHECLLSGNVSEASLFRLGHDIARAIDTCEVAAPDTINWYDIATERVAFLKRIAEFLPSKQATIIENSGTLQLLDDHLAKHREAYLSLCGNALTVTIDNHDENVFLKDDKSLFIDVLPPMSCWRFGVPYANLSNLMVNVETLHSTAFAKHIERGYFEYFGIAALPAHAYGFTHAFAHLISIVHFGTVAGKEAVTQKYIERLPEVEKWLSA